MIIGFGLVLMTMIYVTVLTVGLAPWVRYTNLDPFQQQQAGEDGMRRGKRLGKRMGMRI